MGSVPLRGQSGLAHDALEREKNPAGRFAPDVDKNEPWLLGLYPALARSPGALGRQAATSESTTMLSMISTNSVIMNAFSNPIS